MIDHTVLGSAKNNTVGGKLGLYGRSDWTGTVSGPWAVSWDEFLSVAIIEVEKYEIMMHNPGLDSEVYINVPGSSLGLEKEIEFLQQLQAFVRKAFK